MTQRTEDVTEITSFGQAEPPARAGPGQVTLEVLAEISGISAAQLSVTARELVEMLLIDAWEGRGKNCSK